ncbi:MAG: hypothetical protein Fur005_26940 [Roseiflexaceae bacterium]
MPIVTDRGHAESDSFAVYGFDADHQQTMRADHQRAVVVASAGIEKLKLGVERLAKADHDPDLLGSALVSIHGALEDRFRHLLATTATLSEYEHARVLDVGRVQWNELIDLMRLHQNLGSDDANFIREMNRQRQSVAHGGRFRGKRYLIERYARMAIGFFPELTQETVIVPAPDAKPAEPPTPKPAPRRPIQARPNPPDPTPPSPASVVPPEALRIQRATPAPPSQPAARRAAQVPPSQPAADQPPTSVVQHELPLRPAAGKRSPGSAVTRQRAAQPAKRATTARQSSKPAIQQPIRQTSLGFSLLLGLIAILACIGLSTLIRTEMSRINPAIPTPAPLASPLPTVPIPLVMQTTEALHLRSEPGLDGPILLLMPAASDLVMLSEGPQRDGHQWVRVRYADQEGWADRAFLRPAP